MFGCYVYNPILTFMGLRYPLFNYYGNGYTGEIGSPSRTYASERAASIAHAALGPYGWMSNWGGDIQLNSYDPTLPLNRVLALQRMNYDPTYIPALDPALAQDFLPNTAGMQQQINQAAERGAMEANRNLLQVAYSGTLRNVNNFVQELTQLLKTEGLPAAEKAELEKIKKQTEELKKRIEDYAKTSSNKDVLTARAEVEAMSGEYLALKDSATKVAEKIAAQQQQENPEETTNPENPADPADPVKPTNPTDPADPNLPADPDDPATSPEAVNAAAEEAKKQYNETIRPYINETLLKNKHITAEDKKAVLDKAKEFTNAKPEDKPRILQELVDLMAEVEKKIQIAAQKAAEQANEEATQICSALYTAANGTDWGFGETYNEKKIKDTVFFIPLFSGSLL